MRSKILAVLPLLLCAVPGVAQRASRKEAVLGTAERAAPAARPLPPSFRAAVVAPRVLALAPLSNGERALVAERTVPPRTGVHRSLPDGALDNGTWDTTAEGRRIWHLVVQSPGSTGIRVQFGGFSVGSGMVWLHDGSQTVGPYTGQGFFGDGRFWSDTIFSESVAIEYEPEDPDSEIVPFRIEKIAHQVTRAALEATTPTNDAADACHLDPNCYPDWQSSMKSVAQLVFEAEGFEALCTGALVATRDNSMKPYLMTAGHCISTEDSARSLEAFWTYQKSSCTGPIPNKSDSTKSSPGAHLLTAGSLGEGDYSLLLLKDVPAGVLYAGWDPSEPPVGAPLVGIHHPKGSYKRISFGKRGGDTGVLVGNQPAPAPDYYEVVWDKGKAEPGSSGSPLFSGPGIVVGALTYGPDLGPVSVCQINPLVNGYGRFSVAYPHMRDYLEDLPASAVSPNPGGLLFKGINGAISGGAQALTLTTKSTNPVLFKARADAPWIQLSAVSGQVSAGAPAALKLTIDPQYLAKSGKYNSTVTITSGAADPEFLNVRVDMTIQRSVVAVSFTPNPVIAQSADAGAQFVFQVRLDEQAGAATRITSLKINGTDYSRNIAGWFGGEHLDGHGSMTAALSAGGNIGLGDQYFELTGVDDGSGQTWYQSVTVQFLPPQ